MVSPYYSLSEILKEFEEERREYARGYAFEPNLKNYDNNDNNTSASASCVFHLPISRERRKPPRRVQVAAPAPVGPRVYDLCLRDLPTATTAFRLSLPPPKNGRDVIAAAVEQQEATEQARAAEESKKQMENRFLILKKPRP